MRNILLVPSCLFLLFVACSSNDATDANHSGTIGSACQAAGGSCTGTGGVACSERAATSAQDCETNPPNPAGSFCCLDADSGSSSLGTACKAAGGTCTGTGGVTCADRATTAAQDCETNPPNPAGTFCCLDATDSGSSSGDSSVTSSTGH
jgi:hypothetical protein